MASPVKPAQPDAPPSKEDIEAYFKPKPDTSGKTLQEYVRGFNPEEQDGPVATETVS